ncbi:MAG: dTMP kinase [Nitrososphaerales archaeon]|nr:dTMP kinase [Nitrososphaerales archaeon]
MKTRTGIVAKPGPKGTLIGIEGIDAAGKRTQTSLLAGWLREKGVDTGVTSFPDYSTSIGREIQGFLRGGRDYPAEVRHILFAANRWENKGKLQTMLAKHRAVLVNRYTESNLAYGIANGLRLDWLLNLEAGLPKTDLVLVLNAHPSILYGRRGSTKDRYERSVDVQEKARDAYEELAGRLGWRIIDASKSIHATHRLVASAVSGLLFSEHGEVQE